MSYYDHVYVIAFDVKSRKRDASDVTPQMLRAALLKHAINIPSDSLMNACDGPYETEPLTSEGNPTHDSGNYPR